MVILPGPPLSEPYSGLDRLKPDVCNSVRFRQIDFVDRLLELCRMVAAEDLHAQCPPLRRAHFYVLVEELDEFFFLELP